MLTELRLQHFKSWRDTGSMRLAPVTAIFGSNSSGKTSLLQSLLMIRQTTQSPDRNRALDLGGPNALVDLGTYHDIQFRHQPERDLRLQVAWSVETQVQVRDLLKQARKKNAVLISSEDLSLEVSLAFSKKGADVRELSYGLGDARFTMARRANDDGYELSSSPEYTFVRTQGRAWPLPRPARFYGFPDQVRLYFQNAGFLSDLELSFEEMASRLHYLGPLRSDPQRQYIFSGGAPSDVGKRGELAIDALVASQQAGTKTSRGWQVGHKRRLPAIPMEQLVAEWLRELGLIHDFSVQALDERETLYRVEVTKSEGSVPVLLTDVGFGVSQVLPVLVLLAYARPGDTVILEQPEIHLHPAVQSRLADVLIEAAIARNVQVLVESHSEHLLARLQRRLAEGQLERGLEITPAECALYFCDQKGGESRLMELTVDAGGNITNWPREFFGNPLEDAVAMVEAVARREAVRES